MENYGLRVYMEECNNSSSVRNTHGVSRRIARKSELLEGSASLTYLQGLTAYRSTLSPEYLLRMWPDSLHHLGISRGLYPRLYCDNLFWNICLWCDRTHSRSHRLPKIINSIAFYKICFTKHTCNTINRHEDCCHQLHHERIKKVAYERTEMVSYTLRLFAKHSSSAICYSHF